ncbi:hypothetical protein [Streptomyces sp. NPDC056069]|uniref:hypothetical protein n=1 Tax=Streptomyces sp. NPDC056069 TaxID=3345702 RepID=UPI0035DF01A0
MTEPAAEQLLNLADRAERHGLTPDEAQRLRDGINGLLGDLDAMEHVARSNKAHVAAIVPDLEAATARAEKAEAERDQLARDADRLFKHSTEVLGRAERAEAERDRYRSCWNSARDRAQALSEGTLRHVADRDTWMGWAKKAEAQLAALKRAHVALATQAGKDQASVSRARALASRWGVLRAYGSAATELRAALDEQQEQR